MTTLEQSYGYERAYQGYSYDVRQARASRVAARQAAMSAKDRSRILLLMVVAGVLALAMIVVAAYGASINYTNNQLRDTNAALQSEVDTLEIRLQGETNVAAIQDKAMKSLGMVYAEGNGFVDLSKAEEAPEDLAVVLKDNAYK